jgi:serine protease Do
MKESRTFKGSIGVTIRRVTEGIALAFNINPVRGALIAGIDENGPAKFSGIELGDVIVKS